MNSRHPGPRRVWMGGSVPRRLSHFRRLPLAAAGCRWRAGGPQYLANTPSIFKYLAAAENQNRSQSSKSRPSSRRNAHLENKDWSGGPTKIILFSQSGFPLTRNHYFSTEIPASMSWRFLGFDKKNPQSPTRPPAGPGPWP